mgnify:FL=1
MSNNNFERIVLEDYENEFSFKKNKSNLIITFNRIAFIFFIFIIICTIYSIRVLYLGSLHSKMDTNVTPPIKSDYRADIIDNKGNFLVKSVRTIDIGINPNLVVDKKKLLINLKLIFPNKDFTHIKKKLYDKRFFYLKKKIKQEEYEKLRLLGEKSIISEEKLSRIYPQENLFSHIIGQIDDDNNGISGIEKFYDYELKSRKEPLTLTVDTDVQFLIREELLKFQEIFKSMGSAAILMNVNNGNIISMVSLPDYNLNKREHITDLKFINRATKGIYEFGSVFKTFTMAAGIEEGLIEPETKFLNLEKEIYCAGFPIREYDKNISTNLSAEEILIKSGNIGSVRIGQKIGEEKFKNFLYNTGALGEIDFDIEEVGKPQSVTWGKCKLATASFGHGINTNLLQLTKAYAIISNGGNYIKPTLIKKKFDLNQKKIISDETSQKINSILRKIVLEGTAKLANVEGYEIGGKTGTANKTIKGIYTNKKINTFASVFPTSNPKYVFTILFDEPQINKDYIYEYRDGSEFKLKGAPRNTAGWTSVEVAGKIIDKIGPILATKYIKVN